MWDDAKALSALAATLGGMAAVALLSEFRLFDTSQRYIPASVGATLLMVNVRVVAPETMSASAP